MAKYYELIINDEVVGKLAISEQAIERLNEQDKEWEVFHTELSAEWFPEMLRIMMRDDFSHDTKVVEKEMI